MARRWRLFALASIPMFACVLECRADFKSAGAGTSGAQFLRLPASARSAALASASVALPDDSGALHDNPAGLARLSSARLSGLHHEWMDLFRQDLLSYAQPLPGGSGLGCGAHLVTQPPIEKVDNLGSAGGGSFTPVDLALRLGFARAFGRLSLGASGAHVQQKMDSSRATAFAADLGALWSSPSERWHAGLALASLGSKIGLREKAPLPTALQGGLAWRPARQWLLAFELEAPRDNAPVARLGVERLFSRDAFSLALRGGLRVSGSTPGLSAGLGLRWRGVEADFAFAPLAGLGNSLMTGLTVHFGRSDATDSPPARRPERRREAFLLERYWRAEERQRPEPVYTIVEQSR